MKYLIMKRDMEICHIIQGQIIEIINSIRIIGLTNGDITKTMDFGKTTRGVFVVVRKDMSKRTILYGRKILEDEAKNSTPKVEVNVVMVD